MNDCIDLYLILGFLGSGKTTFLRNLLEINHGKRVGVIVNEFGSVGIDGKVLQKGDLKLVEINNGSIFCSCMKSGFVKTLVAFLEQPVDVLFIEASGMADPSSMKKLLEQITELSQKNTKLSRVYNYKGSVCLVDCSTFLEYSEVLTPTQNQVIKSNFILVNKIDLVDSTVIENIHSRIKSLNPDAFLFDTSYAQVPKDLLQMHLTINDDESPTSNQPWNRPATYVLDMEGLFDQKNVLDFCSALARYALRVKGFFRDQQGIFHLDGVADSVKATRVDHITAGSIKGTQLVIVGRDSTDFEEDIRRVWHEFFDTDIRFSED